MDTITEPATAVRGGRGFWGALWAGTRATVGALMGLAPHVMHHIGFLAGAAFLTGFLGNSLLYVVGLLLSIPLLRRLRRRFGTLGWGMESGPFDIHVSGCSVGFVPVPLGLVRGTILEC